MDAPTQEKDKPSKNNGPSTIFQAAKQGNVEALKKFIKAGTSPDSRRKDMATPLHLAAFNNHTQAIQFLIDHGATVHSLDNLLRTPLHWAANAGHTNAIELLILHGAPINRLDKLDFSPLHHAANRGRISAIKKLIELGADANATKQKPIRTPLPLHHYALVSALAVEVDKTLLNYGADITLAQKTSPFLQKVRESLQKPVDQIDPTIITSVLAQFVIRGNLEKVQEILQKRIEEIDPHVLQVLTLSTLRHYLRIRENAYLRYLYGGMSHLSDREVEVSHILRALIEEMTRYISPALAIGLLQSQRTTRKLSLWQDELQKLYSLLYSRLSLRDRIIRNFANQPFSIQQSQQLLQLPTSMIEEIFYIRQPLINEQVEMIRQAIEADNAPVFSMLFALFGDNMAHRLQELLKTAALQEITEETSEALKNIITKLMEAGADPQTIMIGEYQIPLITLLESEIPLRSEAESQQAWQEDLQRRREIISILRRGETQPQVPSPVSPELPEHPIPESGQRTLPPSFTS